jgi:hypothetical protein
MAYAKKAIKALYGSKLGKLLPALLIAGLVATASATVFVVYYGSATATVATPEVTLVAGSDTSSSSVYKPTVSLSTTSDFATIGITLFPSVTQAAAVQPNIFYTDLLEVHNGAVSNSHSINSITISSIADASSQLGEIDVYYCTSSVNPVGSGSCDEFAITSTTGGSLSGHSILPATLTHGSTGYIEVVAHAKAGATASDTITFNVQISWA